jgi:hypothetical protein
MKKDSIATSIIQKLQGLAQKLELPVNVLIETFLLERLAARIFPTQDSDNSLVLKGAFVSDRIYQLPSQHSI